LFDLCYTVKSYCLVTGDKPLLNMKSVNKINILSITAYKKLIK
jgi:predicted nucleic acid-binding protein